MAQHMIYPREWFMCTWEEYVYCNWWVKYHIHVIKTNWFTVLFKSSTSLSIICLVILSIIENRILECPTILLNVHFFRRFYQFLFNVFWGFVEWLYVVICCWWVEYLCKILIIVYSKNIFLKSIFPNNSIATLSLFRLLFSRCGFIYPFIFNVFLFINPNCLL